MSQDGRKSFYIFEYPVPIRYEPGKTSALVRVVPNQWDDNKSGDPWDGLRRTLNKQTMALRVFYKQQEPLVDVSGELIELERFALIQRGLF